MSIELVFNDGDSFFQDLLESISRAEKSIHVETYIFDLDALGLKFLEALSHAADRGVNVKLLMDGAGCSAWDYDTARKYRREHFEIQFFHPLFWQKKKYRLMSYLNPTRTARGWALMNHRNHRKVYLIDDQLAYVGSFNVSGKHLKSIAGNAAWRDTGLKLDDERCKVLQESFMDAWIHHQSYRLHNLKSSKTFRFIPFLHLNRTFQERRKTYHQLLQRLLNAKKRIYITNPYFIPSRHLGRVLKTVVSKGVEVIAIFPEKSDFFGVQYAMESEYHFLLKNGIQIYQYHPSMIHAKVMVTDDQVVIGSSNLNSRSLIYDLEVDVQITHPGNIRIILDQFKKDLSQSKKVELAEWKKRSWYKKIMEKLFSLFKWVL